MMRTERLRLYPASREQMEAMIASEQDEELKKAYSEMLEGCLRLREERITAEDMNGYRTGAAAERK